MGIETTPDTTYVHSLPLSLTADSIYVIMLALFWKLYCLAAV
jgi:hypothetical protein